MSGLLETDVLIVGAGPSGMVSALCLARAGVACTVVERAGGLSSHPKAHELNARSVEILLGLGFSLEAMEAEASPPEDAARVVFCQRFGEELGCIDLLEAQHDPHKYRRHLRAAKPYLNLSQTELEKLMLARLQEEECASGGSLRLLFGHAWEGLEEEGGVVTSRLRRCEDDAALTIRSRYVIGADGATSRVRRRLGVEMEGPERLQDFVNAYLEMDLREHVGTRAKLYWMCDPETAGTLIAHHVARRWVYHIPIFPPYESAADYTEEVFVQRVQKIVGEEIDVRVRSIKTWQMSAQVAESFRVGRVFLVGDAAHRFPPTGGLGMNTGIADAHNLSWKLAAVLAQEAAPALLDTYEQERRPVALRNCEESHRNYEKLFEVFGALGLPRDGLASMARWKQRLRWLPKSWFARLTGLILGLLRWWMMRRLARVPGRKQVVRERIAAQAPHFDRIGLDIGFVYEEGALCSDGSPLEQPEDPVTQYIPTTRPGARLPHLWLDAARTRSTHDALEAHGYTLLVEQEQGAAWSEAIAQLGARASVSVCSLREKCDDKAQWQRVREALALQGGALLIRPDGHIASRIASPKAEAAATGAEAAFLGLQSALGACYIR